MRHLNVKKVWLVMYMFLAIFEPPILPVSFIYILGVLTVGLLIMKNGTTVPLYKFQKTGILMLLKFYAIEVVYLVIVSLIDGMFIEKADLLSNRIRCINQLLVLSLIQFIAIIYILQIAEELNYGIKDIFKNMTIVGAIQGLCAVAAYTVPSIRNIFIHFGDSTLFSNAYFVERRGFGFSMTLIDTFGYGMGLLAGYLLLQKWENCKLWRVIALVLMLFAIVVNARTGIVVFSIAMILKIMQGENKVKQLGKIIIAIPILYLGVFQLLPMLFKIGARSTNITIKWVAVDMQELYSTLLGVGSSQSSFKEASFFSNFGNLPSNVFEYFLGSGHSIYDTTSILGFRTDIGYINLWWEFGLVGLVILLVVLLIWMSKPLMFVKDSNIKSIVILNIVSYFIVLFKAILIGFNPGVFVNYLCVFTINYYCNNRYESKRRIL